MSELKIRVGFDGRELDRGLKQSERTLEQFGRRIGDAFAALGTVAAVRQLGALYTQFEEGNTAAAKLEATLTRMTGSTSLFEAAMDRIGRVVRQAGQDDGELARSLEMLAVKTGNAEAAFSQLNLVLDVAERFGKDLASATDIVAAAMAGEFRQLGALLPEFKDFVREHENLAGTAPGAVEALKALEQAAGGALAEKLNTAGGQLARIKGLLDEIQEAGAGALAQIVSRADDQAQSLRNIGDELERILDLLERFKMPSFSGAWNRFIPLPLRITMGLMGADADSRTPQAPPPDRGRAWGPWDWQGPISDGSKAPKGTTPKDPARPDPWWNRRSADQPWDFGWMESESDFADQAETYFREFEEAEEKLAKEREEAFERRKEQERELAATLQDGMELVLSGFIDGWDDVTKRAQRMIAERIIAELAKAAAMLGVKLLLGGPAGATPIVDAPIVDAPIGGGIEPWMAGFQGQSATNLQRRTARG